MNILEYLYQLRIRILSMYCCVDVSATGLDFAVRIKELNVVTTLLNTIYL